MQLGIDSFASSIADPVTGVTLSHAERMKNLLAEIELADQVGLDVFGIGEHHRREFLDASPAVILAAAAARTSRIRLTSAVKVLSADDPVRVFQDFATLDLISQGRAEIVVGRGSFTESFPLFGLELGDYDELFAEKLDLLLKIRASEHVTWSGRHRAPLTGQGVYPRPVQDPLPIWIGVGGTPQSFVRAGELGLPLMVAIIGGEPRRFRPLVDLYREAGRWRAIPRSKLTVGVHSIGFLGDTTREAADDFYPGFAQTFTKIGGSAGGRDDTRPVRRDARADRRLPDRRRRDRRGEDPPCEQVPRRHLADHLPDERRAMPHAKMARSIEILGRDVVPIVSKALRA
jgi:probable LLM family oxidoreductase